MEKRIGETKRMKQQWLQSLTFDRMFYEEAMKFKEEETFQRGFPR